MTVINTNVSASVASNAIARNEREMNTAMERLSTGKRVNSAADDAAGLAISSRMSSQVKGLEQAARNTADGISMVQTIEGAAKEIISILTRMKELAVQSNSGTYSASDRTALDLEFNSLRDEITRITDNTKWNGSALMMGSSGGATNTVSLQVGDGSGQTLALVFKDWSVDYDNVSTSTGAYGNTTTALNAAGVGVDSSSNATTTMVAIDKAIEAGSAELSKYGSYINRLQHAQDNLINVAQNTDASRSRIEDADYAAETSELARTQIIAQAGTAMLAQANQIKQTVLALLQ
ncbi:MAG: flagellin FliC [Gammaproteobacteria bacterium]|nr:flagellin FliC [Gammaproteobacteria bacterium]